MSAIYAWVVAHVVPIISFLAGLYSSNTLGNLWDKLKAIFQKAVAAPPAAK